MRLLLPQWQLGTSTDSLPQLAAGRSRCDNVDDEIQEPLHGQDEGGDVVETKVDLTGVGQGIGAVDAGRDLVTDLVSGFALRQKGEGRRTHMTSMLRKKRNATLA